jgi:hypothetical protein
MGVGGVDLRGGVIGAQDLVVSTLPKPHPPRQWSARCPPEFATLVCIGAFSLSAANVDRTLTEPFQFEGATGEGGHVVAI